MEGTLSLFDWRPPAPAAPEIRPPQPRIIVFDCETTGIDFARDQVIELCVQHGLDFDAPNRIWRIKPSVPIAPAAQAVHGIAMEDLADCAAFAAYAGYRYFAGTTTRQIESIAVMPFVNDSGNADVEYLSDGMTETLISSLTTMGSPTT